jgi:hypothetical protein
MQVGVGGLWDPTVSPNMWTSLQITLQGWARPRGAHLPNECSPHGLGFVEKGQAALKLHDPFPSFLPAFSLFLPHPEPCMHVAYAPVFQVSAPVSL